MLLRFIKNWTLPLAMLAGTLGYFFLAKVSFGGLAKSYIDSFVTILMPILIFFQLLLTFCKIEMYELKPKSWHGWLLLFQIVSCLLIVVLLVYLPMGETYREVFEGTMVCLICPTATAAAVITGKLGGSAASLTTYTLFSNLLAALVVPLVFPMVEPHADITFWAASQKILSRVFPLLLLPFFLACFLRVYVPKIHHLLSNTRDAAFYLWAVALAIVSGQTVRSLANSDASTSVEIMIAFAGLLTCCVQFYLGKKMGGYYGERISGGQALGQKNTVLAIWMAYTYLNPLSSVGPGSYVLWQNMINSWQLWKKRKKEQEAEK
ncbi:sodium-dependent transporter [Bacteroides heparinolyticus]|uniref:Sodium-dependent transporter n=1 Tax=Prevotella heparinolytica TaxID=28113 RepID=A0A449I4P5_9BACE|nr:transporter [Bacteroides heparinolyticus]VFB14352.1 sodium-dependent transporter [Bacteroides heparinolyticus]